MLMECLKAGRGISLPRPFVKKTSKASFDYGIYSYIQHRTQFRRPLQDYGSSIKQEFLDMVFNTSWTK